MEIPVLSHTSEKILSHIIDALIIGLLFLAIFQPPVYVSSNSHDAGSQAAQEYWTLHKFSYGTDIIQNVGPLGFLSYPAIFTGFLDVPKLLINIFLTICLIFLLWKCSKILPVATRIVFLIFAGFFIIGDVTFYLLMLLVSYQLMSATKIRFGLLAALILALLALAKGDLFFIALFIILAAVVNSILARRFIFAFSTSAGFIIFLMAFWKLAGQSLAGFPAFVYSMISFSSGYNEAMTIFESRPMQIAGVIVLLGSMVPILWRGIHSVRSIQTDIPGWGRQLLISATEFFILVVVWKHGFVRADGHVTIFFQYILVSSIWTFFRKEAPVNNSDVRASNISLRLLVPLVMIVAITSYVGLNAVYPSGPTEMFWAKYYKMDTARVDIINIPEHFRNLDAELNSSIAKMQLPKTRALAGNHSISYFGILPAVMVYNGFNYVPSPSTISFASWNDRIMNADAMFFRDDNRAPEYLLFDLKTIDNRLVAQDSSLAQLEILHRYEVVGSEAGNLILHRINGKEPLSRSALSEREYNVGDWVNVPQDSLNPVWVKVEVDESPLARIVALAYKPSQYFIEISYKNGVQKTYKFIPGMAATGFMINPLIVDNQDALVVRFQPGYQQYVNDTHPTLSKVVKFRIGCDKQEELCGRHAVVSFEEILGLDLGNNGDLGNIYRLNAEQFGFDAELIDFQVANPIESRTAYGETFYQFHAPSQIKLHKPSGVQKLTAFYGLHPTAYEQGGMTDGVEISVRLETMTGKDMLLFKRDLNPIETSSDRGEQLLDVELPKEEGTLFIEINPKKSAAYDQFLIRNISVTQM
jgi:hypothetical protein